MDLSKTGERIRERRKELGLKQDQLAEMLIGIPTARGGQTISEYENNKNTPPLEKLQQLADILECDVEYLLGCQDHPDATTSWIAEQIPLNREAIEILQSWKEISDEYLKDIIDNPGVTGGLYPYSLLWDIVNHIIIEMDKSLLYENDGIAMDLMDLYAAKTNLLHQDSSLQDGLAGWMKLAAIGVSSRIGVDLSRIIDDVISFK